MEEMDFTVDNPQESVQDDAVQASEGTQGISEILNEDQEGAQAPQDGSSDGREESGGIKGRLMAADQKGYKRGQAEAQAAWQAERARYEERLAKLEEYEIQAEARKLAADENISEALALRLVRAEHGRPAPEGNQGQTPQADTRPRDAQGRFVSTKPSDANARAQELFEQAQNIARMGGPDVMAIFNADPELQARIAAGELDFYDLAREHASAPQSGKRVPPVVPRTSGEVNPASPISKMSDSQFDKLDKALSGGAVFDMRR